MTDRPTIDPFTAGQIWDILLQFCGAPTEPIDSHAHFHSYIADPDPHLSTREYRFIGNLGFGGKLLIQRDRWVVSCYPEDKTPERERMIETANALLDELRTQLVTTGRTTAL